MRLFDPGAGEVREVTPATGRILRIAAGDGVRVAVVADLLRRVADRHRWRTAVAGHSSLTDRQLLYLNVHPFQDPATEAELVVHVDGAAPAVSGRSVAVAPLLVDGVDPLDAPPGADPLALRLALLRLPYAEPALFTPDAVAAADVDLKRWRGLVAQWAEQPSAAMAGVEEVVARIEDDLDLPGALAALERLGADASISFGARFEAFAHLDRLLGLDLAADVGRRR
ncbi:MAG TPA: hypothetical protein VMZ00_04365 [Sporichthya sp.]|nr:hypothetical protein [Sporichthya sp.]